MTALLMEDYLDDLPGQRWYVAHTNAGAEFIVQRGMTRRGYNSLLLHSLKMVRHASRVRFVPRALMSRYVIFAIGHGQSLYTVGNLMGMSSIVRNSEGPLVVPDGVVEELRSRGDADGLVAPSVVKEREKFRPGQMVRIVGSNQPLSGFIATVSLDQGSAVRIWVNAFSREVLATVSPAELTLV